MATTKFKNDLVITGNLTVQGTTTSADAGLDQNLTATAAVLPGVKTLTLNHATVVIAATMVATEHPGFFAVVDTSASGTAAHTVTLTGGTWDGTATIATLNAPGESLLVFFDAAGNGTVVTNTGAVALS
jgi:hypothetical protein